jgi:hypothetical protein
LTTDGVRFRAGPVAIGLYDPILGTNVILATVRDARGELSATNTVTFAHCFDGLDASIQISYVRAGISSWLLLHEAPPDPALFNLSPRSRIELYTELHPDTPRPQVTERVIRREGDPVVRQLSAEPDPSRSSPRCPPPKIKTSLKRAQSNGRRLKGLWLGKKKQVRQARRLSYFRAAFPGEPHAPPIPSSPSRARGHS